jgi:hypothetical protein
VIKIKERKKERNIDTTNQVGSRAGTRQGCKKISGRIQQHKDPNHEWQVLHHQIGRNCNPVQQRVFAHSSGALNGESEEGI